MNKKIVYFIAFILVSLFSLGFNIHVTPTNYFLDILIRLSVVLIFYIPICIIIYFIFKEQNKALDFKESQGYFREILNNYSPACLSALYLNDINNDRNIIAALMGLVYKKKIKLENDKIIVIDNNCDNLFSTEKYILENINDGKFSVVEEGQIQTKQLSSYYFSQKVNGELNDTGLYSDDVKSHFSGKVIKIVVFIALFSAISVLILSMFDSSGGDINIIKFLYITFLAIFIILVFTFPIIFIITYIVGLFIYDKKSDKGKEIFDRLQQLGNYLKEFSQIDKRKSEEINLWGEYLIYSVILGQNNDIYNEYKKYL